MENTENINEAYLYPGDLQVLFKRFQLIRGPLQTRSPFANRGNRFPRYQNYSLRISSSAGAVGLRGRI